MSNAADLLASAFALHQSGRAAEAEPLYRQILAIDPQHPDALHLLGVLCMQSERGQEAVELIGRALRVRPNHAEYANHLGAAYSGLGQHDEAIAALRRAVQIAPQDATSHYNLGTALRSAGRMADAVASFRNAVAANPNSAPAHYNLGNTLRELNQFAEAEASFREALRVQPGYLKALVNLGNVLRDQKKYDESIATLEQAIALDPNRANAHLNLGTVLRDAGRFEEAVARMRRAIELEPEVAEAHNNLGTVLQSLARFDEAAREYDEALRLDPQLPDAHFSRGTWLLREGDFERGFAEYEWRWKCKTFSDRGFQQPRWDGSPLAGRTILLYAEQGLGDTLQFVRYARTAHQRGGRVIVECQPPLAKVLSACRFIDELIAFGTPLPNFDVHAPLMSLPAILMLSAETLWDGPYLEAEPAAVAKWRQFLAGHPGFHVGLCWHGNPQHMFDSQRSFGLAALAPLLHTGGARFVSLQKPDASEAIAAAGVDLVELGPDWNDFADSAAVIRNLDLVITADTALAHLAGGLGAPVWVALSAHSDWRWVRDRDDTPWYPTMRLFRQQRLNEWDEVFESMTGELQRLVAQRHQS